MNKKKKSQSSFINIYGINPIKEALSKGNAKEIYITENFIKNKRISEITNTAENKNIPYHINNYIECFKRKIINRFFLE